jgi:hypothetical protein
MNPSARRRRGKNNPNLIVINEECQFCASTALPVACTSCYMQLCEDCVEYFDGRRVCGMCCEILENPKRLAKVLSFLPVQPTTAPGMPIRGRRKALR